MVTIKEKNFGGKLMKNKNELNFKDLKMTCDTKIFDFDTTQELENITISLGIKLICLCVPAAILDKAASGSP